jgi:hypothetical protein
MDDSQCKDQINAVLRMVSLIASQRPLCERFAGNGNVAEDLRKHNVPPVAENGLRQFAKRLQFMNEAAPKAAGGKTLSQSKEGEDAAFDQLVWEPFRQIRWSFWISVTMSVAMFLIGTALMIIAVYEAMGSNAVSMSSLAIGGLGLADYVILFLRRPWEDVGKNLANSQQMRMIVTSYLSSLHLLAERRPADIESLEKITSRSVDLIQRYTEEAAVDSEKTNNV